MRLDADQLCELAELVADLVTERLAALPASQSDGLVDAAALAARLGVSRAFVYEHADELGAVRLGSGNRARLRFDPLAAAASAPARPNAGERRRSGRRGGRPRSGVVLLPVRGGAGV